LCALVKREQEICTPRPLLPRPPERRPVYLYLRIVPRSPLSYAMKILKKDKVRETDQVAHTLTERKVLQSVKHPYLVNLKYAFQTEDKLYVSFTDAPLLVTHFCCSYMVMEYVRGGELYQHLKRCKFFVPERVRLYVAPSCAASLFMCIIYIYVTSCACTLQRSVSH
jgi:serine/threonine protein kinase